MEAKPYRRHSFATQYTDRDIALLAEVNQAHERLSGPATRRILEREYQQFGNPEFQRLAGISVAHLYNLRRSLAHLVRKITLLPQTGMRRTEKNGIRKLRSAIKR